MNTQIIASTNVMKVRAAKAETGVVPFQAAAYPYAVKAFSLFWSVFGPAARYGFQDPAYAYAALMKP